RLNPCRPGEFPRSSTHGDPMYARKRVGADPKPVPGRCRRGGRTGMSGEPRQGPRRRVGVGVEPLEGRALLSMAQAPTAPGLVGVVVVPSSPFVNQQERSFTATLYLKPFLNNREDSTLARPLTVDFSAEEFSNPG